MSDWDYYIIMSRPTPLGMFQSSDWDWYKVVHYPVSRIDQYIADLNNLDKGHFEWCAVRAKRISRTGIDYRDFVIAR